MLAADDSAVELGDSRVSDRLKDLQHVNVTAFRTASQ